MAVCACDDARRCMAWDGSGPPGAVVGRLHIEEITILGVAGVIEKEQDSARANHDLRLNAAVRYPHQRNVDMWRSSGPGSKYCHGAKGEQERLPLHRLPSSIYPQLSHAFAARQPVSPSARQPVSPALGLIGSNLAVHYLRLGLDTRCGGAPGLGRGCRFQKVLAILWNV